MYDIAIGLAPVLAQYALLGRSVQLALDQKAGLGVKLTVRKHGRVVAASGDEIVLWDDGLDEVRELFLGAKPEEEPPLGPSIQIESMQVRG